MFKQFRLPPDGPHVYYQFKRTDLEHNIKINPKRIELEAVGKIQLALDRGGNREVGIVTCYCLVWGLNRPGILSRWWRGFPLLSRPSLGPTQPPIQWELCLFGGKATGVWR
jgi:hypothetical protein